jgi:hypothetical protein
VRLSQNSVSFGKGYGESSLKPTFSAKSKVAFPKTEVLGKPQVNGHIFGQSLRPGLPLTHNTLSPGFAR